MSPETTVTLATEKPAVATEKWQPSMPPTDLIFDDGEPLESNRHRIAMNVLIRSLQYHWREYNNFFTGGNMFIYYSTKQVRNEDFRGPDFFTVLDVDQDPTRLGWVVWEEAGRYPDVIIELLSNSTEKVDLGLKKQLYEQVFKTKDYFVFHPFRPDSLQGWHLDSDLGYQPLTLNEQNRLWCRTLGLWVGKWEGMIQNDTTTWLRFYDQAGNLVLLPEEAEYQRAEAERQRAEAEYQRAEAERQRAEAERQKAERLAERLRALGEDVEL